MCRPAPRAGSCPRPRLPPPLTAAPASQKYGGAKSYATSAQPLKVSNGSTPRLATKGGMGAKPVMRETVRAERPQAVPAPTQGGKTFRCGLSPPATLYALLAAPTLLLYMR